MAFHGEIFGNPEYALTSTYGPLKGNRTWHRWLAFVGFDCFQVQQQITRDLQAYRATKEY